MSIKSSFQISISQIPVIKIMRTTFVRFVTQIPGTVNVLFYYDTLGFDHEISAFSQFSPDSMEDELLDSYNQKIN